MRGVKVLREAYEVKQRYKGGVKEVFLNPKVSCEAKRASFI